MDDMKERANEVSAFLKGLANPHRLMILCNLVEGEHSVTALIEKIGIGQTSMSQHLLKLRDEGIVDYRRDHRTLYYYIKDEKALKMMGLLYELYCAE